MTNMRFDWRWIGLIAVIAILANNGRLPWTVTAAAFALSGGYLIYYGWGKWTGSGFRSNGSQVKYWRGQRYEIRPARRSSSLPSLSTIGPAAIYFALGAVLLLSALAIALRRLG
jgi:hypothetical protein